MLWQEKKNRTSAKNKKKNQQQQQRQCQIIYNRIASVHFISLNWNGVPSWKVANVAWDSNSCPLGIYIQQILFFFSNNSVYQKITEIWISNTGQSILCGKQAI